MAKFVRLTEGILNIEAFAAFCLSHSSSGDGRAEAYQSWSAHTFGLNEKGYAKLSQVVLENRSEVKWVELKHFSNGVLKSELLIDVTKISSMGFDKDHPLNISFGAELEFWEWSGNEDDPPEKSVGNQTCTIPLEGLSPEDFDIIRKEVKPLDLGVA